MKYKNTLSLLSMAVLVVVSPLRLQADVMEDFVTGDLSVTIAPTGGTWAGVTIDNYTARGEIRTYFGFIGPSHTWTDAPPPFPPVATEEHSQSVGPNHELVRGEGSVTPGMPMQLDTNAEVRIGADDSSGVGHRIEFEGFGGAALDLFYNGPNPTFEVTINAICSYTVDFDSPEGGTPADYVTVGHEVALPEYEGDHMMNNVLPISGDFVYGGDNLFGPGVSFSRSTPQDEGEIDQGVDLMGQWTFDLVQGQKYALVIGAGAALHETIVPEPATLSLLALGGVAMMRRRK